MNKTEYWDWRAAEIWRRIRAWETLPEHPFREKMIQKEQAILARLEAQKERVA